MKDSASQGGLLGGEPPAAVLEAGDLGVHIVSHRFFALSRCKLSKP